MLWGSEEKSYSKYDWFYPNILFYSTGKNRVSIYFYIIFHKQKMVERQLQMWLSSYLGVGIRQEI